LEADDIVAARCGIRAMALAPEGEMIDDFKIEYGHRAAHVINSPSPAATASLSYGNEIVNMVSNHFNGLN
jgi:(S)-2-hydroxyglutarate dehydrogenase